MKFLSLTLVALLGAVACSPITKTTPKTVGSEADEEKVSALEKIDIPGVVLALTTEAAEIVARKQGKARKRELGLRPDERAESVRILANLTVPSIRLKRVGDILTLSGNYKSQSQLRDRNIRVDLHPDPADSSRWIGTMNAQNFAVTCLPLGEALCNPIAGSVIEVFSQATLSNHKPRTFSFLYGETEAFARLEGDAPEKLGHSAAGVLRSVAVLNSQAPVPSVLTLRLLATKVLAFSAKHDPAAAGGMLWRIERADFDDALDDYELAEPPPPQEASIKLPLRRRYQNALESAWTVTTGLTRKLISPAP